MSYTRLMSTSHMENVPFPHESNENEASKAANTKHLQQLKKFSDTDVSTSLVLCPHKHYQIWKT